VNDKAYRRSEGHFKAFCCKAGGGGGRLRHATERVKDEKKQEKEVQYLDLFSEYWMILKSEAWRISGESEN